MGSCLASVVIVNVRVCMDAFDDRFREGVCTLVGGVGVVGANFVVIVVWLFTGVQSLGCEYDECI